MEEIINSREVIAKYLEAYLGGTKLSMSQVAKKWGVSTALLSQIKHKKKSPGLELGLRILREANASIKDRRGWLEGCYGEGPEIAQLYFDVDKQRGELRLQERLSEAIENDPVMLDILLDISLMQEKGLSAQSIIIEYGKQGIEKAACLVRFEIIELRESRYYRVIRDVPVGLNASASFGYMRGIFSSLKERVQKDEFRGEFHFDVTDVSLETYEEIKEMQKEFNKKVINKIKENEMARVNGGKRIVFQTLVSWLKCFVFIILLSQSNALLAGDGNGATGGASGMLREININDIYKSHFDEVIFKGKKYPYANTLRRFTEKGEEASFVKWGLVTKEFEEKQDAIDYAVTLNYVLANWSLGGARAERIITIKMPGECQPQAGMLTSNDSAIKPVGFNIKTSYAPDGSPRFRAQTNYFLPCVKKKR